MHTNSGAAVDNGADISHLRPEIETHEKADLIELLLVLARNKKRILQITLAVAVVAAIVMLLLPNMYTATATILPPSKIPRP